jgi:hypothetical protein
MAAAAVIATFLVGTGGNALADKFSRAREVPLARAAVTAIHIATFQAVAHHITVRGNGRTDIVEALRVPVTGTTLAHPFKDGPTVKATVGTGSFTVRGIIVEAHVLLAPFVNVTFAAIATTPVITALEFVAGFGFHALGNADFYTLVLCTLKAVTTVATFTPLHDATIHVLAGHVARVPNVGIAQTHGSILAAIGLHKACATDAPVKLATHLSGTSRIAPRSQFAGNDILDSTVVHDGITGDRRVPRRVAGVCGIAILQYRFRTGARAPNQHESNSPNTQKSKSRHREPPGTIQAAGILRSIGGRFQTWRTIRAMGATSRR